MGQHVDDAAASVKKTAQSAKESVHDAVKPSMGERVQMAAHDVRAFVISTHWTNADSAWCARRPRRA